MNPWQDILLDDYENHMQQDSVKQLQTMNMMFKRQLDHDDVKTLMILGVAGGNGLEHIDINKIEKVYGIDVNNQYLEICKSRYKNLKGILECLSVDLTASNLELPTVDLVVANLLIEYIGYECFGTIIKKLKPKYVSAIIQVDTNSSFVSDSPYLHVFDDLNKIHQSIETDQLIQIMKKIEYHLINQDVQLLPNYKKLVQLDFKH